ncbi:RNA-guided endonuclease InsQ/TnpB family protein [Capilliphycus salinus ALCB114379]|uniref:RNA-guided endonuclease InsQ/TnpB family protein n=1 Tax=Capilliphycus salinus TaxID=2768948 RepID=UPI0039A49975
MTKQFFAQVNRLPEDSELKAVLEYLCTESNKLYNCTTYLARQLYFKTGKISNGRWLSTVMKNNPHAKAIYGSAAQQTCISVGEAFKGFKALNKLWKQGQLSEKPKPPKYRKSGLFQISYPKKWLKFVDGSVRVPLGTNCKAWLKIQYIYLPFPSNLKWSKIKELQIVPRLGYFDAVWITSDEVEPVSHNVNYDNFLALDPGLDNWLTAVSNVDTSFIVDGKHLKSLNQWYNKRIATLKEKKAQGFWCKLLDQTTEKRNRQMRDAVNKAARLVVNHCLDNNIGTVIFGWNKGQKQESSMGRKNNQKFVSVPTAKLKSRIQKLCEKCGLRFVETEESYTSKSDALAQDVLPKYGEKPEFWKPSGRRITRGQYKSQTGLIFNADINGALNIARKVTSSRLD